MILSLYKLYVAADDERYRALVEFFERLGLEPGETWNADRSKGAKLMARSAGVEIGSGSGFPAAELVLEVDSADVYYDLVRKHKVQVADEIKDADWGARIFTVALPGAASGKDGAGRVAIFSYNQPQQERGVSGDLNASGKRFAIVVSRFNAFITERLLDGALDALRRAGAGQDGIEIVRVPGAFEIPSAARTLAQTKRFDAIICLGCIIRGETSHYEHIATEVTHGIGQSAQDTGVPHAYGVLTCENLEQAIDRAGLKAGNKGFEAAMSAIEMADLSKKYEGRNKK
jgi:6,7-dimethyl-8-ribityllumazine synthase